jgi:hypothetical protein
LAAGGPLPATLDDMTEHEPEKVAALGKRGQSIVGDQKLAVVSDGLMRPGEASAELGVWSYRTRPPGPLACHTNPYHFVMWLHVALATRCPPRRIRGPLLDDGPLPAGRRAGRRSCAVDKWPGRRRIALAEITSSAERSGEDADPYWADPAEAGKAVWHVGIRITQALAEPIPRLMLAANPDFVDAAIIRMPGGGNPFPVTDR